MALSKAQMRTLLLPSPKARAGQTSTKVLKSPLKGSAPVLKKRRNNRIWWVKGFLKLVFSGGFMMIDDPLLELNTSACQSLVDISLLIWQSGLLLAIFGSSQHLDFVLRWLWQQQAAHRINQKELSLKSSTGHFSLKRRFETHIILSSPVKWHE